MVTGVTEKATVSTVIDPMPRPSAKRLRAIIEAELARTAEGRSAPGSNPS